MRLGSNLMVSQMSISMSGPRGLGDKQGGFFLGWILVGGWGGVSICLLIRAVPN